MEIGLQDFPKAFRAVLEILVGGAERYRDVADFQGVQDDGVHRVEVLDAPDVTLAGQGDAAGATTVKNAINGLTRERLNRLDEMLNNVGQSLANR